MRRHAERMACWVEQDAPPGVRLLRQRCAEPHSTFGSIDVVSGEIKVNDGPARPLWRCAIVYSLRNEDAAWNLDPCG